MAHDIFISYSSPDKLFADKVCAALEQGGRQCWIAPRNMPVGSMFAGSLVQAVKASRLVVLVFSRTANKSVHVMREADRAVADQIPILPIRIENVLPTDAMAYYLLAIHWLDAFANSPEHYLPHLKEHVERILRGEVAASVAGGRKRPAREKPTRPQLRVQVQAKSIRLEACDTSLNDATLCRISSIVSDTDRAQLGVELPDYLLEFAELKPLGLELRLLKLSNTKITDESLQHIADLQDLRSLELAYTTVTNDALTCASGLSQLQSLDLSGTRVNDDGLDVLHKFKALARLKLDATSLTDRGLNHLAQLPRLEMLSARRCPGLTTAALDSFRRRRPEVTLDD